MGRNIFRKKCTNLSPQKILREFHVKRVHRLHANLKKKKRKKNRITWDMVQADQMFLDSENIQRGSVVCPAGGWKTLSVSPAVNGVLSVNPAVNGVLSVNPAVNGVLSVSPAVNGVLSVNPAVNGVLSVNPAVNGVLSVNPAVNGVLSVNPAVNGVLSVNPAVNGVLSVNPAVNGVLESGKDKTAKGEGWALPFIHCAQDTICLWAPTAPMADRQ